MRYGGRTARGPDGLAAGLVVAAWVIGVASAGEPAGQPARTRVAPEFTYEDVNPRSATHGRRLALSELYADRGVVLNFLASWCTYCWKELPELQRLQDAGTASIVGIAADEHGPADDLLTLVGRAGLTIPILLVPKHEIALMERRYDHSRLPATYVIDPLGRIRKVFQGLAPHDELLREIRVQLGR